MPTKGMDYCVTILKFHCLIAFSVRNGAAVSFGACHYKKRKKLIVFWNSFATIFSLLEVTVFTVLWVSRYRCTGFSCHHPPEYFLYWKLLFLRFWSLVIVVWVSHVITSWDLWVYGFLVLSPAGICAFPAGRRLKSLKTLEICLRTR